MSRARAERLYREALEKEEEGRQAFLAAACEGDDELRREVESLLGRQGGDMAFATWTAVTQEAADGEASTGPHSRGPAPTPERAAGALASPERTRPAPALLDASGSGRMPWWMVAVATSYVGLLALIPYLVIWGPADLLGLTTDHERGGMVVRSVDTRSLLARAGLRAGDRVVAVDGRPMRRARDWRLLNANLEVGRAQRWEILRGTERLALTVTPERASWRNRVLGGYISYAGLVLTGFAVGLFVALRRPGDPAARIGAWFIATAAIAFGLPNGWAVAWRQAPLVVQAAFWIPETSRFVLDGIFLSLFLIFPRPLFRARWPWILVWAPVVATLPWRVAQFHAVIHRPSEVSGFPAWVEQAAMVRTLVYLVAGIAVLVVSYRRLLDAQQKRRVRVLMAGTGLGAAAAIVTVAFSSFWAGPFPALALLIHPLNVACPLAFAYAILRHRVFGIRVIVRQGLQYALARGAMIGLVPVLGALLLLDLTLNRQETLATILEGRGWAYATLGGLALVAHRKRRPWLDALDRRFFREAHDRDLILLELVESVKESASLQEISRLVSARISAALHPESVFVLYREPTRPEFAVGYTSSAHAVLPAVREDSSLVRALAGRSTPLEVGDSAIESGISPSERAWLQELRIDLVVPMRGPVLSLAGLILLGQKRSEEPYSPTDRKLLQAIAGQVAIVCENVQLHDRVGRESRVRREVLAHLDKERINLVKECPACGRCFDRSSEVCPEDRSELSLTLPVERVLEGRYRLERVLGRGGMGAVYEATDTRLSRSVGVKIMTGHLFGQPGALRRFEREARASAHLSHPNVVAVHDYGRIGDQGAFLVMELLRGATMRVHLERQGRVAPAIVAGWFDQVLDGLAAAHDRGIVHRDLKPENVMICGEAAEGGLVKILDFGLAKAKGLSAESTGLTVPGTVMGTWTYMSPEQLGGREVDERGDLFSIGVMVVECVTGRHPFRSRTAAEMEHAMLHLDLRLGAEGEAARALEGVLTRCLAYDPADRFASAGELRRALVPALRRSPAVQG